MDRYGTRMFGLALVLAVASCSEAPTAPAADFEPAFGEVAASTNEHIFDFPDGIPASFAGAVAAAGGTVVRTHPQIDMAVTSGLSDAAAAAIGGTATVARDVELQWVPTFDPSLGLLTHAGTPGAAGHDPTTAFFFPSQWDMHIIDAPAAWAAGATGAGVRVAILDTGIDPDHQDLAGLIDTGASAAFIPAVVAGPFPWVDDHFHGTHVAGSVVTNGIGTSGVAPHTTLIAVKVLSFTGGGSFAAVIGGILHAADVDADIINMSLSAYFPKNVPGGGDLVAALNKAVNYANSKGVLVVSAAGNAGIDLQHDENATSVPCESGAGICISATGPTDAIAGYSNYGTNAIHVAAPGGDYNGNLFASTVLSPCSSYIVGNPCPGGISYVFAQGTSMASPHAAGVAALIDGLSGGGANAGQLKSGLAKSADDLGKKGSDPLYGSGRVNAFNAVNN